MNTKLAITILLTLCLSACTVNLQDQLNDQHSQLLQIQKQLHQLDKTVAINQADAVNEQDKLRRDLQSLQGTLEESSYRQEQRHARLEKQLT
ncbi:MAG: hypothetical protein GY868_13975, partial [Deltaproteobacteria bacterium]|nr:hypothetical protein [Deltaproteobacteria bacterium]